MFVGEIVFRVDFSRLGVTGLSPEYGDKFKKRKNMADPIQRAPIVREIFIALGLLN